MRNFIETSVVLSVLLGAAWGLANFWCMARLVRCAVSAAAGGSPAFRRDIPGRKLSGGGTTRLSAASGKKWRLAGWVALKLFGLYAAAAWLLIGLRVPAIGWLVGFTLSLAGVVLCMRATGPAAGRPSGAPPPGVDPPLRGIPASPVAFLFMALSARLAEASEAAEAAHPPEIPNFITLFTHFHHGPIAHFLNTWENSIFVFVIVGLVGGLIAFAARSLALLPTRGQVAAEAVVEGLDNMVCGVLGRKEGRRYLPFLGTLFIFILSMNLAGLVPGLKSPTSRFEMTGALGLCVFVFVQWTGIRRLGPVGYVDHLIGQPRDAVGWILSPLMLFIHGIGEIVKPVSLSLRLFGNIMGEDTLLGVFVMLGAVSMAWSHLPIGLPLHLPFVLLAIIFSVVQALVFTMLSMIYIYMMLPYDSEITSGAASSKLLSRDVPQRGASDSRSHEGHAEGHSVRGELVEP